VRAWLLLLLAGCGPSRPREVVGPFSGPTVRFAISAIIMPQSSNDFAHDLNGDRHLDNRFGNLAGAMLMTGNLTPGIDDMLGSGVLSPAIEITSDDSSLQNDLSVGARFIGASGEVGGLMGSSIIDGRLVSNDPAISHSPASADLHMPLLRSSDPIIAPSVGLYLEITFSSDGQVGAGRLNGAFVDGNWQQSAYASFLQTEASDPSWLAIDDTNRDGMISFDEFKQDDVVKNLTSPDVQLFDSPGNWAPNPDNRYKDSLSFGFAFTLVRCESGSCHDPPVHPCQDRILDGDETDIDCGGSCPNACGSESVCARNEDCLTHSCANHRCAQPTCTDGMKDGLESDVDCGDNCPACATSQACRVPADCSSGPCDSVEMTCSPS
jgi:hypothetical protein